ncbi:MAG: G5 domain-containing protein [Bifidobacteriaceae bacterium]|jgi:uncharacterized protein YabE (DUF348 family)|nr:G5 domain-containing protein [Bifidobacteriaceae bacterium]MCI1978497.1 G5 domain-containing protein [Bifidobacteriaceae bacterium]
MSTQWTPGRFARIRRLRIAIASILVVLVCVAGFFVNVRKTVALEVNGKTREVTTYASSATRLLQEQGVTTKTHDQIETSSGQWLTDHSVVRVRQAYQVTLTIDGKKIPYWTVAKSMSELAQFFKDAQTEAVKIDVNISNVYNQLTGGLVINEKGPVTVIADGKKSIAPNGKLTAASILDSKGITLGKDDRVGIEKEDSTTILKVERVTHGTKKRVVSVTYQKVTVEDPNLEEGTTEVRQAGKNGAKTETLAVTYVDGKAETQVVTGSVTTADPVDEIIAVGTKKKTEPKTQPESSDKDSTSSKTKSDSKADSTKSDIDSKKDSTSSDSSDSKDSDTSSTKKSTTGNSSTKKKDSQSSSTSNSSKSPSKGSSSSSSTGSSSGSSSSGSNSPGSSSSHSGSNSSSNSSSSESSGSSSSGNSSGSSSSGSSSSSSTRHLTAAEAKSLAKGMMRDFYGWGNSEYSCLVTLWQNESGWRWNAANSYSDAYGIPQALPGSKMGTGWKDDAAVQIRWGLSYIKNRYDYGSPCKALAKWNSRSPHWY